MSTNSLSRAQLNYDNGVVKSVHYGDILVNYNTVLDVKTDIIPFITEGEIDKYKSNLLKNRDLVFADAAEDMSVGKAIEINNITTENIVAGLHTIVARARIQKADYFLGYYINSDNYHRQLLRLVQGTKVSSISKGSLKETKVSMPEILEEQKKIGSFFKLLDETITLHHDAIQCQQALKKGLLQQLFPAQGQSVPELRFSDFNEEWEQRKLGEISDITKLAGFEFTEYVTYSNLGNIIALRGLNIKSGSLVLDDVKYIDNSDFSKLNRSKLYKNDLLLTYVGTIGQLALIPEDNKYYLAPNVARIRIDNENNPMFISQQMASISFYSKIIVPLIATSSQPALSMANIRKFKLEIPNLCEQHKIGTFFKQLDDTIVLHQAAIQRLQDLKKGFLQKMFVN